MNVDQWKAANVAADAIQAKAKNPSSIAWFKMVDKYYMKEIATLSTGLIASVSAQS